MQTVYYAQSVMQRMIEASGPGNNLTVYMTSVAEFDSKARHVKRKHRPGIH